MCLNCSLYFNGNVYLFVGLQVYKYNSVQIFVVIEIVILRVIISLKCIFFACLDLC